MKGIILGAGYSVRLYPLTKNMPKPLIRVAGIPIVERLIDQLKKVEQLDQIFLVTNSKFYTNYENWLDKYRAYIGKDLEITLVDDGTWTNETRLGAIGGVVLTLDKFNIQEDVLISAGDNLFEMDLQHFCDVAKTKNASALAVYKFQEIDQVRNRFGVAVVDNNNRLIDFEEKPCHPKSTLAATAIYVIKQNALKCFRELYHRPSDREIHIGEIIPELLKHDLPVYCEYLTRWIDIGTHEDLEKAEEFYAGLQTAERIG